MKFIKFEKNLELEVHHSFMNYDQNQKSIVTIGTFDGVHFGHQKIIKKLVHDAKAQNCRSVVLTFFPHPQVVLNATSNIKMLNTIDEKTNLLQVLDVDAVVVQAFDKKFSELSAEDFVKLILVDQLNVKKIIIGHDHRFGKNRAANFDDLISFGKKYRFEVEQISAEAQNEIAISSTKIRNAIINNDFATAKNYLGYCYFFSGKIVHGKQLGRTIGFPTANIFVEEHYKLIPNTGVYVVRCQVNNNCIFGMMNIGNRPTVNGQNQTVEVHLFDFENDIYNQSITVSVLQFLRNEQKFDSINGLKQQLAIDKEKALHFIKNNR